MAFADLLRAVFALILVLGLVGLAAVALRRFGPGALARFGAPRADRRLKVLETLVLDPSRRLVLVACDDKESLILLGDGQVLAGPAAAPKGRG
jgi:flagellar protein FliO/FliZ